MFSNWVWFSDEKLCSSIYRIVVIEVHNLTPKPFAVYSVSQVSWPQDISPSITDLASPEASGHDFKFFLAY